MYAIALISYREKMPPNWLYADSKTGYIDSEIYLQWFKDIFVPYSRASPERPVLLIVDGHESHINYEVAQYAIQHNIDVIVEPPHSSHFLQPCDMIFKYLKNTFADQCQEANLLESSVQVKT